jgi:hypothetical protein
LQRLAVGRSLVFLDPALVQEIDVQRDEAERGNAE